VERKLWTFWYGEREYSSLVVLVAFGSRINDCRLWEKIVFIEKQLAVHCASVDRQFNNPVLSCSLIDVLCIVTALTPKRRRLRDNPNKFDIVIYFSQNMLIVLIWKSFFQDQWTVYWLRKTVLWRFKTSSFKRVYKSRPIIHKNVLTPLFGAGKGNQPAKIYSFKQSPNVFVRRLVEYRTNLWSPWRNRLLKQTPIEKDSTDVVIK